MMKHSNDRITNRYTTLCYLSMVRRKRRSGNLSQNYNSPNHCYIKPTNIIRSKSKHFWSKYTSWSRWWSKKTTMLLNKRNSSWSKRYSWYKPCSKGSRV